MKFIEDLLQGAEVQWLPLGEICKIEKGKQLNKTELHEEGLYPAYNGGVSFSGFTDTYNYEENTTIISQGGASAGFINFVTTKFYANAHCYVVLPNKERVDNRYVYHFLKSNQSTLMGRQAGAGIPALHTKDILGLLIPVPPMPVQKAIANILDRFAELEAELEAELNLRKKQYEYYREYLLNFSKMGGGNLTIVWKPLGEIGEIKMCKRILKHQTSPDGEIPFYKIGTFGGTPNAYISRELYESYKKKYPYPRRGEVLISASGTIGRTVVYDGEPAYFQDSNIVWISNDESIVYNRYLFYVYQCIRWESTTGGTIQRLYNRSLADTRILIPPLEEQKRITDILDKFDTLTSSITEGLPKEIELRRKQYEYYRDQLLSFRH